MNKLQVFNFSGNDIRVVTKDGQPWWVAKDVCEVLEIKNNRDALARLDEDEKGVDSTDTLGGAQQVQVVNEPGLYSLILGSRKPEAKQFKRWITHEVIPTIRKTGAYSLPTLTPNEAIALSLKQTADMMTKFPVLENRLDQVEQKVDEQITLNSGEQNQLKKSILTRVCQFEQDKDARKPLFRLLYKELYERYDVPSYKDILRKDLKEALQFVGAWRPKRSDLDRIAN